MHKHANIHTQLEYSMLKILVGIQWKIANEMRIDTSTLEKYENIFWVIKITCTYWFITNFKEISWATI